MLFHVTVIRPEGYGPVADQLAEQIVASKKAEIEAVGGDVYVARTFAVDNSMIVVNLPEGVAIAKYFSENVRAFDAPVAPASHSTTDEPNG